VRQKSHQVATFRTNCSFSQLKQCRTAKTRQTQASTFWHGVCLSVLDSRGHFWPFGSGVARSSRSPDTLIEGGTAMFKYGPTKSLIALSVCLAAFMSAGCERKERVIDVKTPAVDVKVDRNIDNGNVEVKTERK
jgi:hypothetical protein